MKGIAPPALDINSLGIHTRAETNYMDTAICRVCMARGRVMVNIFEAPPGSNTSISDMISECTGIYISHRQAYPKTICRTCVLDAQNAFEFKRTFERSHQHFSRIKEEVCIEGSLLVEDQFLVSDISEVNPFEGTDDRDDNATSSAADRPFKCSHCLKTFGRKQYLNRHIQTHTGERPFQCKYCLKSFSQKHILKVHLHTHTGERQFKCSHCSKLFSSAGSLKTHMSIHLGIRHKCSECPKTFSTAFTLKAHSLTYHGGKPVHKCFQCPEAFAMKVDLKRHMFSHTEEEQPYKCFLCYKSFTRSAALKEHMRNHTKSPAAGTEI